MNAVRLVSIKGWLHLRGTDSGRAAKRRVLLLLPNLQETGGIQRVAVDLVEALRSEQQERVSLHVVEYETQKSLLMRRFGQLLFDLRSLRRVVTTRPQLIISLNARYSPLTMAACRVLRRPYVVIAHGREVWGPMPSVRRHVLPGAQSIWCVSGFTADRVAAQHRIPQARLRILRLGVAVPPSLPPREETAAPTVLYVGRLESAVRYKGLDSLLAAWPFVLSQQPEAELLVVGDGSDLGALQRLAQECGVAESTRFLGRLSDDEVYRLRLSSWLACFPSRVQLDGDPQGEGLGLVALESMALGIPLVSTRDGGLADVAIPAGARIVKPSDSAEFGKTIADLLADSAERDVMRNRAFAYVSRERTMQAFRTSLVELLEESLSDSE